MTSKFSKFISPGLPCCLYFFYCGENIIKSNKKKDTLVLYLTVSLVSGNPFTVDNMKKHRLRTGQHALRSLCVILYQACVSEASASLGVSSSYLFFFLLSMCAYVMHFHDTAFPLYTDNNPLISSGSKPCTDPCANLSPLSCSRSLTFCPTISHYLSLLD